MSRPKRSACRSASSTNSIGTKYRPAAFAFIASIADRSFPAAANFAVARLFDAQEAGAGDTRLQEIAAEALKEVYFQDGVRRARSLEEVFTLVMLPVVSWL
ncbi:hypothetical protein [Streptomyces sp. NPDC058142]|uniref:hypothetical protein n=1 Tax=Streptomyces sp. NPDC058142 TaxID=3346355 RepID=UPI0036E1F9C3